MRKLLAAVVGCLLSVPAMAADIRGNDFVYQSPAIDTSVVSLNQMLQDLRNADINADFLGFTKLAFIPVAPAPIPAGQVLFFNLSGVGMVEMFTADGGVVTSPGGQLITTYPDAGYVTPAANIAQYIPGKLQVDGGAIVVNGLLADTVGEAALLTTLTLAGNMAAATAGTDVTITTTAARTAGAILDVQNNANSALKVLGLAAASSVGTNTANTVIGTGTLTRSGTDPILTVINNATEDFSVLPTGSARIPVAGAQLTVDKLGANAATTTLTLAGNMAAATAATDVTITTTAARTAGAILDVQNNANSALKVLGLAAGSSAGSHTANTVVGTAALTRSGTDPILLVENNVTDEASVDVNGNLWAAANTNPVPSIAAMGATLAPEIIQHGVATCSGSAVTVTFTATSPAGVAFSAAPTCFINDHTAATGTAKGVPATTTLTITSCPGASDVIDWLCIGKK